TPACARFRHLRAVGGDAMRAHADPCALWEGDRLPSSHPGDPMSAAPRSPLYLEDLAVGDTFRSSEHRVELEEILRYAREFDPQPFHLDAAAAKESFFGELVASGWHTASLTMRMMVECLPFARGLVGAGAELRWPRPTRPGDVLHVEATVRELTPSRSNRLRGWPTWSC